jgi:1,4-dihydroxy-2-naphthoate octaprenyltransferase
MRDPARGVQPQAVNIAGTILRKGMWAEKAKGWFLEFRVIPVLLWSYTAVVLGTAVAYHQGGTLNPIWFLVALALGGLIQGWETHAINEIYDWRSGTDRIAGGRALSGGSRVRNLALLSERDLWSIFAFATLAVVGLTSWVVLARAPWLALLIGSGYVLGLVYTLPPIATAYRPWTGEWLGGFPGVLLAGLGAFAIQTLTLSWTAAVALSAHALVCTAMLVVHHYLDAPMDEAATPKKQTTVLALGLGPSRGYASAMAAIATSLYGVLGVLVHPAFFLGAGTTAAATWFHLRIDPSDMKSVTRNELRVIQLGIAGGLSTAVALAPPLWPMLPLAVAGYFAHLVVASPPAELARAWRKAPATDPMTHRP